MMITSEREREHSDDDDDVIGEVFFGRIKKKTIWDFVMLRHTYIICQSSQDDAISFEKNITCCV
jgi:hypothetical protein